MKGTILDFLNLSTEKPELAKALVELAARFDFEFNSEELSDAELESIAGGLTIGGEPSVSGMTEDQVRYMTYTLENAMITGFNVSSGSEDPPPTVDFGLNHPDP
ncbi:hypothetical protein ACFL3B_05850 [Gemmatimonadota bacterium]